jgi:hypothetical protein
MSNPNIAAAIEYLGGVSAVARRSDPPMTPWAVSKWKEDGLPPKRVLWLAGLTEWKFTPHMLAPELYPNDTDGVPTDLAA